MGLKFKKACFILSICFLYLLSGCTENYEITPITTWKQLNNFPGIARASASSFVIGDKAYVCLGRSGARTGFLKDIWEYDSKADTWIKKNDFPGKARVKAISGVIGDKVYVGLGSVSAYEGNQFNDFWEYDSSNDSWKQMASFPGEAKNDLFCAVVDSCLFVTDGFAATGYNFDTYKYSPITNSWTRLKDCPVAHSSAAGFTIGSDIYIGSGFNLDNFKDFYCYHSLTDTWSRMADLPDARILSKGISINGKGYIMLGRYWDGMLNGGRLLKDIVEYNPQTNTWTKCGDFPGDARQNIVAFVINGKGYIVGGEDDSERKSDVWVFAPSP